MDFKVTYLDAGLTSSYFSEGDSGSGQPNGAVSTKVPKRYKAHLRDFLSSCRTKRSKNSASQAAANVVNDIYAAATGASDPASGVPYVYPPTTAPPAYGPGETPPLYMQQNAISPYGSALYPVDNRYFSTSEYLASYRSLTTYYPEYSAAHAQYIAGNGYFDSSRTLSSLSAGYDASRYFDPDEKNHGAAVAQGEFKYKPPVTGQNDFSSSSTSVTPSQTPHSHPGSGNSCTSFSITLL